MGKNSINTKPIFRRKPTFFLVAALVSSTVIAPFMTTRTAYADATTENNAYYGAIFLRDCLQGYQNDTKNYYISEERLNNGSFLDENILARNGIFLSNDNSVNIGTVYGGTDGNIQCKDTSAVKAALSATGYGGNAAKLLTDIGYQKVTKVVDIDGVQTNITAYELQGVSSESAINAFNDNIFNPIRDARSPAAEYAAYQDLFNKNCSLNTGSAITGVGQAVTLNKVVLGENGQYEVVSTPAEFAAKTVGSNIEGGTTNTGNDPVFKPDYNVLGMTCSTLLNNMNNLANAVVAYNNANPDGAVVTDPRTSTEDPGNSEKTCNTEVKSVGWFICPGLETAASFADAMWNLFEMLLNTNPLSDPIKAVWVNFRNIANALLILIFLIIVFSQTSNLGINNYGVKKILPRLVIIAIVINMSFFLMQVAVDLANILGKALDDMISQSSTVTLSGITWEAAIASVLAGTTLAVTGTAAVATAITVSAGPGPFLILLALLILPAVIAFIAGLAALIFRTAMLPILAVLAPIALVAHILPNTQGIFEKWKKTFTSLLFLYPLASVYFGGLKLGANIIAGTLGWFGPLLAVFVLFFGAGAIIILAIKSNSIAGKAFGAVSGALNKASAPIQKWGKDFTADKRLDFMYGPERRGLYGFMQRRGQAQRKRAGRRAVFADLDKQQYEDRLVENPERELGSTIVGTPAGQARIAAAEAAQAERARATFERDRVGATAAMGMLNSGRNRDNNTPLSTADRKALRSIVVEAGDAGNIEQLWNQSGSWQDPSERNSFAADLSKNKPTGVGRGDIANMREGNLKEFRDVLATNAVRGAYNAQGSASADASEVDMLAEVLADGGRMSRALTDEGRGAGQITAVRQKVANDANTAINDTRLGAGKNRDSLQRIVDRYRTPGP